MVKGKKPFDEKEFSVRASRVAEIAPALPEGFIAGSHKADVPTRAKPEIWDDSAGFNKAAQRFVEESQKLAMIAKSGNEAAMKAQFGQTGETCKGCHQDYRQRKN